MVATKCPYGAIDDKLVDFIMFHKLRNKYYIIDNFGSRIEIDKKVYETLKGKGVKEK